MITAQQFKKAVYTLAKEIGVEVKEIHMRKMKRKWASCSSKGRLTFDTTLLNETVEVRLRAIIHELLHLKYPNHGRMFKTLFNIYLKKSIERLDLVKSEFEK
jgi:hypothetical protein